MTVTQNPEPQKPWAAIRQGWKLSIVLGFVVTLIRFKAVIPLVWQILVQDGTTHTVGTALGNVLPFAAVIAGCVVCIYAVQTGYQRINQALEQNDTPGNSTVAVRGIVRISLLVNGPILYWAIFLFVLLPQLVKIPNASLGIGSTTALAAACMLMVVIAVLATHLGLLLTRFSFTSIMHPLVLEPAGAPATAEGGAGYGQPGGYMQPGPYPVPGNTQTIQTGIGMGGMNSPYVPQPGGYYPPGAPAAMTPDVRAVPGQSAGYAPQPGGYMQPGQQVPYAPQGGYSPVPGNGTMQPGIGNTQTGGMNSGAGEQQGVGAAGVVRGGERYPWR